MSQIERARGVDRRAVNGERADLLLHGVIGRVQRLLGGEIDDAARVDDSVENGPRALQHVHALDIGQLSGGDVVILIVGGVHAKAVAIIGIRQKAAQKDAAASTAAQIKRAIRDGDPADILQSRRQGGGLLILQHLLADHLHVEGRVHDRRVGLCAGRGVLQHVALVIRVLRRARAAVGGRSAPVVPAPTDPAPATLGPLPAPAFPRPASPDSFPSLFLRARRPASACQLRSSAAAPARVQALQKRRKPKLPAIRPTADCKSSWWPLEIFVHAGHGAATPLEQGRHRSEMDECSRNA